MLIDRWVFEDLSVDTFPDDDRREILADIGELREPLPFRERQLPEAVDILDQTGSGTIYKRRQGDVRTFRLWERDGLYCIGVACRPNASDRDLATLIERAREWRS